MNVDVGFFLLVGFLVGFVIFILPEVYDLILMVWFSINAPNHKYKIPRRRTEKKFFRVVGAIFMIVSSSPYVYVILKNPDLLKGALLDVMIYLGNFDFFK